MSSVSSICLTPRELILLTKIFGHKYMASTSSWSNCFKLLNLSMRTWHLLFATSFMPPWFSLIVFHSSLAFFYYANTQLNTFSQRKDKIILLAIISYCLSLWLSCLVPSLINLQTFKPLAWRYTSISTFHRWKSTSSNRGAIPKGFISSPTSLLTRWWSLIVPMSRFKNLLMEPALVT